METKQALICCIVGFGRAGKIHLMYSYEPNIDIVCIVDERESMSENIENVVFETNLVNLFKKKK
jgi:hypothetical protein